MGSAAGVPKKLVYKNKKAGKVRDSLEIPFGDGTQSAGAAYYSSSSTAAESAAEAASPQTQQRRHTVQERWEVDIALLRVATSMLQDVGAAEAAAALRRASTSEQSQDS
eukprot:g22970.t1